MSNKTKKYLIIIVALAAALRLIGITHSFPFIFHPDEPTIIRSALAVRFNPNPDHFDWPHLYIYLNYALFMGFAAVRKIVTAIGYKETVYFIAPMIWNDELIFYLLSRSFTALLGALTAIPVYLTTKTLFGEKPGLWAALALAITPFHVWHSHYALADVPMMFFLAWSLYFTVKILFKKAPLNYIFAGLFAGLAASTKYNGAIIVFSIVLAHILRVWWEKGEKIISFETFELLFYAGVFSIFGFLMGTPFALLDFGTFIRTDGPKGALWQFTNVGSLPFKEHLVHFFTVFPEKLAGNFGYSILALFIFAVAYLIIKILRDKNLVLHKDIFFLVLSALTYIYYVSGFESDRAHYYFIVYPFVIIAGVGAFHYFISNKKWRFKNLIWLLILLPAFIFSLLNSYTYYQDDSRVVLYQWAQSRTAQSKKIYYTDKDTKEILDRADLESERASERFDLRKRDAFLITEEPLLEDGIEVVLHIDNHLRRGPEIYIYHRL